METENSSKHLGTGLEQLTLVALPVPVREENCPFSVYLNDKNINFVLRIPRCVEQLQLYFKTKTYDTRCSYLNKLLKVVTLYFIPFTEVACPVVLDIFSSL